MAKKQTIPAPALALGLGGLLPFILSTAGLAMGSGVFAAMSKIALTGYGAVILSFLGGIRWGMLLNDKNRLKKWSPLVLSIVPSLVGWTALLVNFELGLLILIVGFAAQYYVDRQAHQMKLLPPWFLRLRGILTSGVLLCLFAAVGVTFLS